jgi:orotate phosphoribosyltransferase
MDNQEVLDILSESRALLSGHFELRSGLHSDRFFQCAMLLRYPDKAEKLCQAVVQKLVSLIPDHGATVVIAPALGGIVVGHEVARALGVRSIFAEKVNDKLVLRRGFKIAPGEKVIVAEDVITRGGRVQETIDIVESLGGIVAGIAVLVNRSGGKAQFDAPLVSLLEMEPVTYEPSGCPMCERGEPMEHPGS